MAWWKILLGAFAIFAAMLGLLFLGLGIISYHRATTDTCPEAVFAAPIVATWNPSAPHALEVVVVRWTPTKGDLPDAYYATMGGYGTLGDAGAGVKATHTGPHELTITIDDLGAFVASGSALPLQLGDPAKFSKCHHIAFGGGFVADVMLTLAFDRSTHIATATFGAVASGMKGCSVGPASNGSTGFVSSALLMLAALARRRARARSPLKRAFSDGTRSLQ